MRAQFNHPKLKDRRKELRKNQTDAERILWQKIKNKQINNLKFFRQYSVGPYILDFFCPKFRLAIELDGGGHSKEEVKIYDQERSVYLLEQDIQILRFWNNDVVKDIEGVLHKIAAGCSVTLS